MIWVDALLSPLLERFGETTLVLGFLIRGLVVLGVCAALLALLGRYRATWRHEIALTGMMVAAALPVIVGLGGGGAVFVPLPTVDRSAPSAPRVSSGSGPETTGPALAVADARGMTGVAPAGLESPVWRPELLPLAWLVGLSVIALAWGVRRVAASVRLRPWRPVPDAWRDRLRAIGGSRRQADRLALSSAAPVPLVWGIARPRIVLPPDAEQWDGRRLEIALRHELAHIRRGDPLTRLVANLATLVHWPNPVAWISRNRLELERELACDREVIAGGVPPSTYARELLDMAMRPNPASAGHRRLAMAERSNVERRIRAALDAPGTPVPRLRLTRLALVFVIGAVAMAVSSLHAAPETGDALPGVVAGQRLDAMGGTDLERLAAALRGGDLEELRAAGRFAVPRRAVTPLAEALDDPDASVRRVAAWALGETRSPRAAAALRDSLLDPDPRVRAAAAHGLGDVGGAAEIPELIRALEDGNPSVRLHAAHALGDLRDTRALDALAARLHDPDVATRVEAAWALGEIAHAGAVGALTSIAVDTEEPSELRTMAIRGLGEIRHERSAQVLARLTVDADWRVRSQAADALGALRRRRSRDLLERLAREDPNAEVRTVAAKAARRSR